MKKLLISIFIVFLTLLSPAFATTYNITYELNGGSLAAGVSNPTTYDNDASKVLDIPTKSGYTFVGWYDDDQFTGSAITTIANGSTGDKTFYAKWSSVIYYDSMGNGSTQYYVDGNKLYYNSNSSWNSTVYYTGLRFPTKSGYAFRGWCAFDSEADAIAADYDCQNPVKYITANSSYTTGSQTLNVSDKGDLYLYAKWVPIYDIHYNSMGADTEDDGPTQYYIDGNSLYYLRSNSSWNSTAYSVGLGYPYKSGYTFRGWCAFDSEADAIAADYDCQNPVKDITVSSSYTSSRYLNVSNKGDLYLYAKWTPISYTITYNLDNGTNNANNPSTYTVEYSTITLQNPTKSGYTFIGWYDNDQFTGNAVTGIPSGSTGDKTFYAKWIRVYNIHYNEMNPTEPSSASITRQRPIQYYISDGDVYFGYEDGSWNTDGYIAIINNALKDNYGNAGWCVFDSEQANPAYSVANNCSHYTMGTPLSYNGNYRYDNWSDLLGNDLWLYIKWIPTYNIYYDTTGAVSVPDHNPATYYRRLNGYYISAGNLPYLAFADPVGSEDQPFQGWYVCTSQQSGVSEAAESVNCSFHREVDANFFDTYGITYVYGDFEGDLWLYAKFAPPTIDCDVGYYAYNNGSSLSCKLCESGNYCPGGILLNEETDNNGLYSCGENMYSFVGAADISDCISCSTVANSAGTSNTNGCVCNDGYSWNSYKRKCQYQCPSWADAQVLQYKSDGGILVPNESFGYDYTDSNNNTQTDCIMPWLVFDDNIASEEDMMTAVENGTAGVMMCKGQDVLDENNNVVDYAYIGPCTKVIRVCDGWDELDSVAGMLYEDQNDFISWMMQKLNTNNYANMFTSPANIDVSGTGTNENTAVFNTADCNANTVNINWGTDANNQEITGTCTYGGAYTAPSSTPAADPGYKFIGWKVGVVNNNE